MPKMVVTVSLLMPAEVNKRLFGDSDFVRMQITPMIVIVKNHMLQRETGYEF
jgi:hypothetical protein